MVIRTALAHRESGCWSVHVGGAITALAEPETEWEETCLKARAVLGAIGAIETESTTLTDDAR